MRKEQKSLIQARFIIYNIQQQMQGSQEQFRQAINEEGRIKHYIRSMMKDIKDNHPSLILENSISYLANIFKNSNEHPSFKVKTTSMIIYLLLMGDPDVYQAVQANLLHIFKTNCLFNRTTPLQKRGEEFFKKTKFYLEGGSAEKQQIKKAGCQYIIFSLETVYNLAKWLPYDIDNQTLPTKFSTTYQALLKQGIQFPKQCNFQFYPPKFIDKVEQQLRQIEKELYSSMNSGTPLNSHSIFQLQVNSQKGRSSNLLKHFDKKSEQKESQEKISSLEKENIELQSKLAALHDHYQNEMQKKHQFHKQNIKKYEEKICYLSEEIQKMKEKIVYLETKTILQDNNESKKYSFSLNEEKDRVIEDLTKKNHQLQGLVKSLSSKNEQSKERRSDTFDERHLIEKLKKENKVLKAKLLVECQETIQFKPKTYDSSSKRSNRQLQFLGSEDAKACYEPFYSNSSNQNKVRLRKAILREKQLLFKDKNIEIGCITKWESRDSIRLILVCTNVSQKPISQFLNQFISRDDITIRLLNESRNYLQIGGQTKSQLMVTIKNIDFRCLMCSLKFMVQEKEQKVVLIMPVSKIKFARQLVFTPMNEKKDMSKLEKLFNPDRKIIPSLNKFKQYFKNSLLETDRTGHETYNLRIEFMGRKFYLECDEVGNELRLAIKYQSKYLPQAEKLLDELSFIFSK